MSHAPHTEPARPGEPVPPSPLGDSSYDSFVVRVLSQSASNRIVQGQVTHVATRRTLRFTDPQRVVAFMLTHLGRRNPGRDSPARADAEDASC